MEQQSNKVHRKTKDPAKNQKKKLHVNGYNAKAFAVAAPGRLERTARRSHDIKEKTYHVPMVDRTPEEPPPVIVAVVGPPGTGKSTLIKSLVRRFTKHTLNEIKGPITVVSGKRRRLTFIECSNDLSSMIDVAKIADLILLLVDGNFGFEMETMEFLNIVAPHGFPRILGVTTHLDLFKSVSTMRASKKALKNRFWTEVYQGAKLFYLSGVINGRYPDREILNLARFISVMKFRPLKWRNEHYYVLADRVVDITHPTLIEKNPKVDRKVTLYGYIHGTPMPYEDGKVHIPGIGDLTIKEVERLPDPCPTPYKAKQDESKEGVPKRRKRLDDKMKTIYAPMSDVGGVLIDKDAVYIDVGTQSFVPGQEKGIGEKIVTSLQSSTTVLGHGGQGIQMFGGGGTITELEELSEDEDYEEEATESNQDTGRRGLRSARVPIGEKPLYEQQAGAEEEEGEEGDISDNFDEDDFEDDSDARVSQKAERYNNQSENGRVTEEFAFAESDSDLGDLEDGSDDDGLGASLRWKSDLAQVAKRNFGSKKRWDINRLIYMKDIAPEDVLKKWKGEEDDLPEENIEDEDDELFFKKKGRADTIEDDYDQVIYNTDALREKWANQDSYSQFLADRIFVVPKISGENGDENTNADSLGDDDEELYGDFEDLEAEAESKNEAELESEGSEGDSEDEEADAESDDSSAESDLEQSMEEMRAKNAAKKEKMRLQMDQQEGDNAELLGDDPEGEDSTWHDIEKAKIAKQLEINKAVFDEMDQATRDRIEGFRAGAYVRMVFEDVPCEFIQNFNPVYPVIVGGLLSNENRFGFSQVRIKRHRWHKKILKTNDPFVISLGWRRFQTMPIYTTSDSRTRNRMLKYTPEHMHCTATFYGPLVSPNTGFCAFQNLAQDSAAAGFRVCATGTVLEVDKSIEIVKKLKLVGHPTKIYKNTAFIKDMFSSSLEIAKFEGAAIKTVSGIRGQIKRALAKPEGHFRATFEDKILMSDIVILRAWFQIMPKKFYNPVTSLLLADQKNWKGMRLTGQVRAESGVDTPSQDNSRYQKIERATRRFNPLKVPKSVQKALPFSSQIHQMKPQKKKTYVQKRAVVLGGEEKKARELMQKVMTLRNEKDSKRQAKSQEKRAVYLKKVAKEEATRKEKERERRKEYFEKNGKRLADAEQGTHQSAKRSKHTRN